MYVHVCMYMYVVYLQLILLDSGGTDCTRNAEGSLLIHLIHRVSILACFSLQPLVQTRSGG